MKDATAAAVYGVRAAAGVILITTKRGAVQKPTVTYNGSLTLSQNTDFPKFLNGPDYAYWYNKAQLLDGVAEENLRFSPEEIDRITNPGENEHIYGNTDWFDLLFRNTAPTYTIMFQFPVVRKKLSSLLQSVHTIRRVLLNVLLMISIISALIWMQRLLITLICLLIYPVMFPSRMSQVLLQV